MIYLQRRYGNCEDCYIHSLVIKKNYDDYNDRFCSLGDRCTAGLFRVLKQVIPTKLFFRVPGLCHQCYFHKRGGGCKHPLKSRAHCAYEIYILKEELNAKNSISNRPYKKR